ncbi:MAG: multicopper oxidase domain-containing protein [Deltaproteobacteria bacterium]|nr:multicopper oxidase domain-containing protein [Deltaproteobacteria bacterium]
MRRWVRNIERGAVILVSSLHLTGCGGGGYQGGGIEVPTGGPPSPLFGAQSFTQQLLLFEEFGTEPMPAAAAPGFTPLPQPLSPQSGPNPDELEAFLAQDGVAPLPTRLANVTETSPWKAAVEAFLGRPLVPPVSGEGVAGPAEGRPGGEGWAHQRFDEFAPQVFFKTAQAGARTNGGFRDARQRHGYATGEFGRGGLYNTVYKTDLGTEPVVETTAGLPIQFHPALPVQNPNSLWTFDGTVPAKLLLIRNGQTTLMRHYNALPIDVAANNGFGRHTITTHEHNGHQGSESDGFTAAFFFPGQFYDYRLPLHLGGYDRINTTAADPPAAFPCEAGETLPVDDTDDGVANPALKTCVNGRIQLRGDWRETESTHWFHDHMLDFTAQNVYKGNATMMNYYSALDRGNEALDDGVNLRFPSGTALDWGNRDYDVNLLVADKAWDLEGQLRFDTATTDGFLGDRVLTNWLFHPFLEVRARRYRLRILNGAVARFFGITLVHQVQGAGGEIPGERAGISYNRVPFHLIANDGNVMVHAVPFDGLHDLLHDGNPAPWKGQLQLMGIAERSDIIVDFAAHGIQPGDKLYFVNVVEHANGRGINRRVPLEDILSGRYDPQPQDDDGDGVADRFDGGDPGVGKFLEFRVVALAPGQTDQSMNPVDFEPGKQQMVLLPIDRNDPALASAPRHLFEFVRQEGGGEQPWKVRSDGSQAFPMVSARVMARIGSEVEIVTITGGGGWDHPVHIHFEEGVYLSRDGREPPEWEKWTRKDMYRIGRDPESTSTIEAAFRAREFTGLFMAHCHNTTHEDRSMLMRWDAQDPANPVLAPSPVARFDGVDFEASFLPEGQDPGPIVP